MNNKNAVNQLLHEPGVFIDESRIVDDRIILKLLTETPVISYKELFSKIQLELRTITPELYKYNQYLNTQTINSRTNYTFPVKPYSNVDNGLGIFGAYSNRSITIGI